MPAPKTRSLRHLRTAGGLADRRRVRTRAGALQELAALAHEKELLRREQDRCERRRREIEARLAEIREKEGRLEAVATLAPEAAPAAASLTVLADMRVQSFQY